MIRDKVISLLREHQPEMRVFKIQELSIFGSVARNQETPQSDVDILVKFDGPATYDTYMELKFYLEELLNRKVDLITVDAVRKEIKEFVEKDLIRVA
jgi:uncharacterized protein